MTFKTPRPAPSIASDSNLVRSLPPRLRLAERYRPREIGTGYGNSSGYARDRGYLGTVGGRLFRCN
ncbi:MAG: hypothetical protein AB7V26_00600 [Lysobacterales bacterium]